MTAIIEKIIIKPDKLYSGKRGRIKRRVLVVKNDRVVFERYEPYCHGGYKSFPQESVTIEQFEKWARK